MMACIEDLYDAAAQAGLLVLVTVNGKDLFAEFTAPDSDLFDGLGVGRDYAIRYPASYLDLQPDDIVHIATLAYEVRDVRAVGDGSECRARLSRL